MYRNSTTWRPFFVLLLLNFVQHSKLQTIKNSDGPSSAAGNGEEEERRSQYRNYSGHTLMRIIPQDETHLMALHNLSEQHQDGVDFWKRPVRVRREVDMLVSPEARDKISSFMTLNGLQHRVVRDNIQRSLDEERESREQISMHSVLPDHFNLSIYHTYDEIMNWLDYWNSTCDRSLCQTMVIGTSYEGRDIKLIKISGGDETGSGRKPAFWVDAGIHAREWIAPSTALYLIDRLLDPNDKVGRYLSSRFTWYILPVVNPDGYAYTWTTDRLWRKTRSRNADPTVRCRGTDPNRNWDFHWGGRGTSDKPCNENYGGVAPFSEPETRAMADFLLSISTELYAYISLHSYGQYWLTPWGYTYRVPDDYNNLMNIAKQATDAMHKVNGVRYEYGSASRMLYLASGGSDDWVKGFIRIKYSYTVELRDQGENGFILPPSDIQPTGAELVAGVRAMAGGILRYRRRHRARSLQ